MYIYSIVMYLYKYMEVIHDNTCMLCVCIYDVSTLTIYTYIYICTVSALLAVERLC